VIEVNVEEQSTGEVSLGVGYSTNDGPLGLAGIRERNLLGKGQDLALNGSLSGVRSQIQLSFTEPYFMDRPLAVGFDLFDTRTTATNTQFTENDIGGTLRAGYDVTEFLHHTLRYTMSLQNIEDVDPTASLAVQQEAGTNLNSVIGSEFLYDRRDNRFDPSKGYYVRLRNELSTVPGDFSYLSTRLGAGYYFPLTKSSSVVAGLTGEIGHLQDLGKPVFISNSYQLGGQTFRGFETSGIGPRDQASGDSLGGKDYAVGTFQVSFPMGLPEEYQVRGHAFTDFGTLTNTDADIGTIQDSASLRVSAGFGIIWKSPFGPIGIDIAYPILKQSFDLTQLINFSVGTSF
jgi:outer membrane protein insertion porin family